MENLLEIQNLNKSYKKSDFQLSDISLTLEPNEVVGIIGKNGSGKSTLINTLVGNRFKDSGEIRYFDKPIAANDNQHKEHIGVVFDDLRVPNKLTIQDIDKVFSKIYKTWDSEKFFAIIKTFELPTTNEIASFSRGMRMKAALTIALSHDSKVLILDEATAGMDVSSREEVIEILEDYVAKGNGILISSHISEDIEHLATKLVFMKNGEIILEEKKDKLFNHYGIVEQDKEELNIPNDILIASRVRKGSRISLINDRTAVTDARPLETIDDAIKLIMRGDS